MPPAEEGARGVNNGRFRAYYLPDFRSGSGGGGGGGTREPDPAMTLDNTFKVKLFWIASRANNCYYCLGHQEYKLIVAGVSRRRDRRARWRLVAVHRRRAGRARIHAQAHAHTARHDFSGRRANCKKHYTPNQVLEIVMTVAGYNSTNRWTDGLNIPAEENGNFFRKTEGKFDVSTFKTPTSAKYAKAMTKVAPLVGSSPPRAARPALEDRAKVEAMWSAAKDRKAILPLANEKAAADLWPDGPAPNWVRLLATFPKSAKGRVDGIKAAAEKGTLNPRLKAEIAWASARTDRAWYALAVARDRLKGVGFTEDQMFALDGESTDLPVAERSVVAFAENSPPHPRR